MQMLNGILFNHWYIYQAKPFFFRLVLLQVYIQVPQMTYTFFYLHQLESIPQQVSVNVLEQNTSNT